MIRLWKDIKGYEGLYKVNQFTDILNFKTGILLKPVLQKTGYLSVTLCKDGVKKIHLIHRLVAEAFIPNPDNKPEVDHINTIKTDNRIENLRWVTYKEQMNNPLTKEHLSKCKIGKYNGKYGKNHQRAKPVLQFDKNGNLIREWECEKVASDELGISKTSINNCLMNRSKTAGGYIWRFVNP